MNIGKRVLAWAYQRWVETPIEAWRRQKPERNYESAAREYGAFLADQSVDVKGVSFRVSAYTAGSPAAQFRLIAPDPVRITETFTVAPVELEAGMLARALEAGR